VIDMGRIENGKIANHSGVTRPRLSSNELWYLIHVLDNELNEFSNRGVKSFYTKELARLKRKLRRNQKRLCALKL
jgi:hypothetical protein